MTGSEYNQTEKQTAIKLTKADYLVVFPNKGHINRIKKMEGDTGKRKNDVYIYDKKTYMQRKVDLKTCGTPSAKAIREHIISGSGQAPVIVLDIMGKTFAENIIKGFRRGWSDNTKSVLLNYKGQWYELDRDKVFSKWIKENIK
jgi:hypothetical protein